MTSNELTASRRGLLVLAAAAAAPTLASAQVAAPRAASAKGVGDMTVLDPIKTELVMNLVVTCSKPEVMGPSNEGPDGRRGDVWPIIGGRFEGPNIRGSVVPGGGDFPVTRPDGVTIIDALYRLRTDDGYTIIIHNRGYAVGQGKYRLVPTFIVNAGPYAWLNKGIFVSTLVAGRALPDSMRLAKGPDENDRLIQLHRVI